MPKAIAVKQRELVRGVVPLDIEARIGLGIAEALGGGEAFGEGEMFLLHAGQDVVAGAVEDAVDAVDRVAGKRLAQRLDDRDAAGGGRLEIEADARRLRLPGERHAVARRAAPCWR